ncbi:MAG: hypothetical protein IJD59_03525 [Clostridia bacterium]|nr:hypothetical protein [Clostridia bacterium]
MLKKALSVTLARATSPEGGGLGNLCFANAVLYLSSRKKEEKVAKILKKIHIFPKKEKDKTQKYRLALFHAKEFILFIMKIMKYPIPGERRSRRKRIFRFSFFDEHIPSANIRSDR